MRPRSQLAQQSIRAGAALRPRRMELRHLASAREHVHVRTEGSVWNDDHRHSRRGVAVERPMPSGRSRRPSICCIATTAPRGSSSSNICCCGRGRTGAGRPVPVASRRRRTARERDPYSQRISFVFPSGYARDFSLPRDTAPTTPVTPDRFRDPEFRRHAERVIQQACPAHLMPTMYWVDQAGARDAGLARELRHVGAALFRLAGYRAHSRRAGRHGRCRASGAGGGAQCNCQ